MRSKDPRRNLARRTQIETLEERVVMSADPLGGLLGSVNHHALADDPNAGAPIVEQHSVEQLQSSEAPSLGHHGLGEPSLGEPSSAPTLGQHGDRAADFWIDPRSNVGLDEQLSEVEQSLNSAHGQTGLDTVRANYGFRGGGQTVAVIDSGIAYTHYALGGGFGAGYRVVGGYDFTESGADALDPYDDGPNGGHGTHVSGIIGGDAGLNSGVAPDVDIVGLRVFDDAGNGLFSWVEDALDWVHENRNNFDNPITAVNLSLGTEFNSDSVPNWAMLENEFAQLEADGIFIAVSAGNSFQNFNTPGLSYPAASPYVVPVMSTDDSGMLSYFSQRHQRAIAAPGRFITSTVPDYAANDADTIDDDFASWSGTSMASPYVAGASVIIREAMEFVGTTNITQDLIYDHMMATADQFVDSSTGLTYDRLNLEAAVDALMPTDDYGSTAGAAHSLGTLSDSLAVSGHIAKLDDVDFFTFTADVAGTVSMSVSGDHGLQPNCAVIGASGTLSNDVLSFDVEAGETYTISIETAAGHGIGNYDASLSLEAAEAGPPVTVKTIVTDSGVTYSLDSENWLSINGNRLWSGTQDFSVDSVQDFVWHGTTGLLQRHTVQGWETLSTDATKHAVGANARVFSLDTSNVISVNGSGVWGGTHDFHISSDNTMYWHGVSGGLQKLPYGGAWQTLDTSVNEFAVRSDGVAYALTADGNVTVDGVQTYSGISDLRLDSNDQLILVDNSGGLTYQAGVFALSSDLGLASTQAIVQGSTGTGASTSSFIAAALSDANASFVGSTQVGTTLGSQVAETAKTEQAATDDDAKDNLLSAVDTAYSQESLLAEDSAYDFAEEADELASTDAVDSLFEKIGSFV